jgi:DNA-binding transcriptional LysR family regulator
MNNVNWDDIRYVLAVARHGSLNAAATALGVTHATVLRRVAAFEKRYRRAIFQKLPSGYKVLPEALPILGAMANIDDAVLAAERTIAGADQSPTGKVRIASTDSICQMVLPPILGRISESYPNIELTLLSANVHHDLTRLTADIVVRPTLDLGEGLRGICAGHLVFHAYTDGGPDRKWMKLEGALSGSVAAIWMADQVRADQITGGADSFLVLQQMAASGLGKALLPSFVGDADPRLQKLESDSPKSAVPVWVATLKEFAQTPRFVFVQKMISDQIGQSIGKIAT